MFSIISSKLFKSQLLISFYSCIDIDGESRVKNDLEIVCYTGEHSMWSLGVALPSLIVWGLGIPMFALFLLIKERKTLESLITR